MSDFAVFPQDFLLGAATAAYQIEGGTRAGNRGESIWDRFSHTPGKTYQGHTGDVACDHFYRWREDVALMARLGLHAYRFSIAWPRVIPEGRGAVNLAGLDFYDRLVDALLDRSIQPFVTLYHWDLPQALQDIGGWPNRDLVGCFADYAAAVARRLGDRVHHWITFNEPWVFVFLGYFTGDHPPGLKDLGAALQAAHHVLAAHGVAADVIRAHGGQETQVGITLDLSHVDPATDSQADLEAAHRHDGYINRWFLDPLFHGRYPEDMLALWGDQAPEGEAGDLDLSERLDFLGINNYRRVVVGHGQAPPLNVAFYEPEGSQYTDMGWEVSPDGLYKLLVRVYRDYGPRSIYITENGAAFPDVLRADGVVDDQDRVEFVRSYTFAALRALEEGVPLKGYFVWTLLDNFEWVYGYSKRFGIVYVDFSTQERIIKQSGYWYQKMIAGQ